ncbi:MAG: pentapeptide repeat-containing protein, partial [Phycicoccus sp.]
MPDLTEVVPGDHPGFPPELPERTHVPTLFPGDPDRSMPQEVVDPLAVPEVEVGREESVPHLDDGGGETAVDSPDEVSLPDTDDVVRLPHQPEEPDRPRPKGDRPVFSLDDPPVLPPASGQRAAGGVGTWHSGGLVIPPLDVRPSREDLERGPQLPGSWVGQPPGNQLGTVPGGRGLAETGKSPSRPFVPVVDIPPQNPASPGQGGDKPAGTDDADDIRRRSIGADTESDADDDATRKSEVALTEQPDDTSASPLPDADGAGSGAGQGGTPTSASDPARGRDDAPGPTSTGPRQQAVTTPEPSAFPGLGTWGQDTNRDGKLTRPEPSSFPGLGAWGQDADRDGKLAQQPGSWRSDAGSSPASAKSNGSSESAPESAAERGRRALEFTDRLPELPEDTRAEQLWRLARALEAMAEDVEGARGDGNPLDGADDDLVDRLRERAAALREDGRDASVPLASGREQAVPSTRPLLAPAAEPAGLLPPASGMPFSPVPPPLPGVGGWGRGSTDDGTVGRPFKKPVGFSTDDLAPPPPTEPVKSPAERARRALEYTDRLPELPEDTRAEQLWRVARALDALAEDVESGRGDDAADDGLVDRLRERATALRDDSRQHITPTSPGPEQTGPATQPLLLPAVEPAGLLPAATEPAVTWPTADRRDEQVTPVSPSVFPGLAGWGGRGDRRGRLARQPGFSTSHGEPTTESPPEDTRTGDETGEAATSDDRQPLVDRVREALDVTAQLPQLPPDADDVQRADLSDRLAQAARILDELRTPLEEQLEPDRDHTELVEALRDRGRELRDAAQRLSEPTPSRPAATSPMLALPPAPDQRSVQELWQGLGGVPTPTPPSSPQPSSPQPSSPQPLPSSVSSPASADAVPTGTPQPESVDALQDWALDRLNAIDQAVDEIEVRPGATWKDAGGGPLDHLARARESVVEQLAQLAPELDVPPHPALVVHEALEDLAGAESAVQQATESGNAADGEAAQRRLADAAERVREVRTRYADGELPQGMSLTPYVYDSAGHADAAAGRRQVERQIRDTAPKDEESWRDVADTLSRLGATHRGLSDEIGEQARRAARLRRLVDDPATTDDTGAVGSRTTPTASTAAADLPGDPPATPPVVATSRLLEMLANVADAWWLAAPGSPERDRLTERKDELLADLDRVASELPPGLASPTPYVWQQPEHRDALRWRDVVAAAVEGTPVPEPGTPAAADLSRLGRRRDALDDLLDRFEAADDRRRALLSPLGDIPAGIPDAPTPDDLVVLTDHLFDDATDLPASAQDRVADALVAAGLGVPVPGLRSTVNALDECDACLNAAFTAAMGKRFGSAEPDGTASTAPAVAMSSRSWDGTPVSRDGRSTTRWTDLWRTLQRLPLVFTTGGGADPLDAAKDAVRQAARPGRPAHGMLKISYPGAAGSLPSHTVLVFSDDGEPATLRDAQTGVDPGDDAIRTGAAHVDARGPMPADQLRALPPQELRVELLFTHDEDGAALVPLPDHVLQGYAAPADAGTKVSFHRSEQPRLDALGVAYDRLADNPSYVEVTYPTPYVTPAGADRRVWLEYDSDDPSRAPHILAQHDGRRADRSWSGHGTDTGLGGSTLVDRVALPDDDESLGYTHDGGVSSSDPAEAITRHVMDAERHGQDVLEIEVRGLATVPLRFEPADGDSLMALTRWLAKVPDGPPPVRVTVPGRVSLGSWGHRVSVADGAGLQTIGGYHFATQVPLVVSPEGVVYGAVIAPPLLAAKTYGSGSTLFDATTREEGDLSPGWEVVAHQEDAAASLERAGFRALAPGVWARSGIIALTDADGGLAAVAMRPSPRIGRVWVDRVGGSPSVLELDVDGIRFTADGSDGGVAWAAGVDRPPSYGALGLVPHLGTPLDPDRYPEYEALMRPGRSSSDAGFLSADDSLENVLERDAAEVARLGVTHQLLSGLLQYVRGLLDLGVARSGPVEIDVGGQRLRLWVAAGFAGAVDSPISRTVAHRDYAVVNLSTGARLVFNGLLPELAARGFYEGSVPHRREPRDILAVFAGTGSARDLVAAARALGIPAGGSPAYVPRTPPQVPVGGALGPLVRTTVRGEVRFDPSGLDTRALPARERFWTDLTEISRRYGAELGGLTLDGLDLSGLDLHGIRAVPPGIPRADDPGNTRVSSMRGVNLREADLSGADLEGVRFSGADLSGADLGGANLAGADLAGANLAGANLAGANLEAARFVGAVLVGATLKGSNLARTTLLTADLRDADLRGAHVDDRTNLIGTDLRGARLPRGRQAAELAAEAAFGPRETRPAELGRAASTVPVLSVLDAMARAGYPEPDAQRRRQLESALAGAANGQEVHLHIEAPTGRWWLPKHRNVVTLIAGDPVQVVIPPNASSPGTTVPLSGSWFFSTQPEQTSDRPPQYRITRIDGPFPGTSTGGDGRTRVDPTLPSDEESFGVSGDDRPGDRANDESLDEFEDPLDGFVVVSDWWGRDSAVLEFLEDIGPWLGDMAVSEDELLDIVGSDAVALVVDSSGAVGGLARAVLVVGEDGSTTGRVESMLVDPRYRGGVVERELSRGMEGRLAELGADRIEWPVVRPQGSEPVTSVFQEPRYAGLVGSAVPSSPSQVRSADSQGKPLGMKAGDIASAASQQIGGFTDAAFGQTFATIDASVLRPVEESGPVRWLGGTAAVQATGDGLNAVADAYRAVGRFAQNNPAMNRTLGWYQALVRQMRYFPAHLLAVKAHRDQVRTLERALDFYDDVQRRTEALVTEAESLAAEVERQQSRKAEAERLGDRISVEDADRQIRPTVWRLGELTRVAAVPLVELGRRATTQIGRGETMLRRQERAVAVRRAELDEALRADHGIETPRVLTARARAIEAAAPFDLAAAVTQAREQYQALQEGASESAGYESVVAEARAALDDARVEAGTPAATSDPSARAAAAARQAEAERLLDALTGQDRDAAEYVAAVERARVVYELAKADLAKFTLAGNDAVLGLILDRDEGLGSQLDRLQRLQERSTALVDGLRRGRRVDFDGVEWVRSAVDRLREVRIELGAAREVAQQRRERLLRAPITVRAEARADQLSVDARAAGSQLRSELGQIGFLHSQAKDIVDGKGKGRIDVLSNAATIEDAAGEVALVRAEVAQWQARIDGLTEQANALTGSVPERLTVTSDPPATLLALLGAREEAARRLAGAARRLETRERRLGLEQRAAEPRSIRVRVADLRAKVDTSADLVRRIHATHARRQAELTRQIERAGRSAAAAVDPARQRRLQQREQQLRAVREANDYALNRAVQIHRRTEALLPRAEEALRRAAETAGITPGKLGRNFLRGNIVAATAAKAYAVAQLSLGWVAPDTAADLAPLLKQLNLPGAEVELVAGAIQPVPGVKGLHSIDTAQGRVYAWRVRGTFSDVVVVAQPTPQARGSLMAAIANGGTLGTLSPSIQKGTDGVYLTLDSQRFQLAGVTISSVFHPDPTNTAFNWWETVKIEFGATGVATRFNSASTNPRTKAKQPMIEMAQSNSIKAPLSVPLPGRVPFLGDRLSLPPTVGMAVTVKNSLGVGRLSLVYDPELGVGQVSDRTSSMAAKHNFRQLRPITEFNPGDQPYGFFGTAIRIEKNYYAIYDPRNTGNWLMAATEPAEALFDAATGKTWPGKPLTGHLQSELDSIKPSLDRTRTTVGDAIEDARDRAVRTLDDWLHDLTTPPPVQQPSPRKSPSPQQPSPQRPAPQQQPAPRKSPSPQQPAPKQPPNQQKQPAPQKQPTQRNQPAPQVPPEQQVPSEQQAPSGQGEQSVLPSDDATYGAGSPGILLVGAGWATPIPGLDVNPLGGTRNCVNKAVALDRLRAGMPASALPGDVDTVHDLYRLYGRLPESGFGATAGGDHLLPGGQRFDVGTLQAYIEALPVGARGIVLVHYRSMDRGHVLLGENVGGRASFFDSGAVLDPRALSTGAIVRPELLLGVSTPDDLPDLADAWYSFLRTDDVPYLLPVPEHVQAAVVLDLDTESGLLLVTDPILGASRWVDATGLPSDARPRRGEPVYVVDGVDADGRRWTEIRSQRDGLWLDPPPPPPPSGTGLVAEGEPPTASSASSDGAIERRPLPGPHVLLERMTADPGVPVGQIVPTPVSLPPGWRKVFLIGARRLEGGALFDGWLTPEELFADGVLVYPPQLPDIGFVDTDGGPVLNVDPAGSRWYRHAFTLSSIAGRADGKAFALGTTDRSFLEFEMFFLRPDEETTGRPVIVEAHVPTAVDVRATMFRARYGEDYRPQLERYLQDPDAFLGQLSSDSSSFDPEAFAAGSPAGTGELSLPFDPPRYQELAFPGGIRPELIRRVHLLDFTRTTEGDLVFPPLGRRDLVDQERYFLPTDSPSSPDLAEQRVYSESIRNPRFDPEVVLGDLPAEGEGYIPPGSGYQGTTPDDEESFGVSGDDRPGERAAEAGLVWREPFGSGFPVVEDVGLGRDLASGAAALGARLGADPFGGDVYRLVHRLSRSDAPGVPQPERVL